jgi:UV radiation resistance-associated gene protein
VCKILLVDATLFHDTIYRDLVAALRRHISPIRVSLVTTLAHLFPIDLISASDLLFSILGVPLPIPLGATDPAPPLSLLAYKDVNEEGVATALAYAALVVQLLAGYLDRMLVYPITFCGSRSMIRDGISAMVGPRMCVLVLKKRAD